MKMVAHRTITRREPAVRPGERFGEDARGFTNLIRRCDGGGRAPARSAVGPPMVKIRRSASDRKRMPASPAQRVPDAFQRMDRSVNIFA